MLMQNENKKIHTNTPILQRKIKKKKNETRMCDSHLSIWAHIRSLYYAVDYSRQKKKVEWLNRRSTSITRVRKYKLR